MFHRLDRILACNIQTDGQTDGQTSFDGIVRALHTHRAVKMLQKSNGLTLGVRPVLLRSEKSFKAVPLLTENCS